MKNSLTQVETAKLYNFLLNNQDLARNSSADELAAKAMESLSFKVGANNVNGLRRQMGLNPRPGARQASGKVDLEKSIVLIARELCGLKTALGGEVSDQLKALAAVEV